MTLPVVDQRIVDIQQRLTAARNELALCYLRRSQLMAEQTRYLTQREVAQRWGITQPRVAAAVSKARSASADLQAQAGSPAMEQHVALQHFGYH